MKSIPASKEYAVLLKEVRERIRASQYAAFKAVNKELIHLYWDIGQKIFERQINPSPTTLIIFQAKTIENKLGMAFYGSNLL